MPTMPTPSNLSTLATQPAAPTEQPKNPLHGFTLQQIVELLLAHNGGFAGLAKRVKLNCFTNDPSVKSSLKFLRKTPWARTEIEQLFIQQKLYQNKS